MTGQAHIEYPMLKTAVNYLIFQSKLLKKYCIYIIIQNAGLSTNIIFVLRLNIVSVLNNTIVQRNTHMSKKAIIIISSVLFSVLAAVICALLILHFTNKISTDSNAVSASYLSEYSSAAPSVSEKDENSTPDFQMFSPDKSTVSTTENHFTFSGKLNTDDPLTLNGQPVEITEDGLFSVTVELKEGKNTFTFVHKGKNYIYTINYRYVILQSYSPYSSQSYKSGSTLAVSAKARKGSTVTASFNGQTITLKEYTAQDENGSGSESFTDFIGSFKLPSTDKDTDLGKITFKATLNGRSESFSSGNIICQKAEIPVKYDPNAEPLGDRYINVGTGKITEIIDYEAETFDAYSTNDWSKPTNNYLPKGTVDYSAQGYVYYQSGSVKKEYAVLRCGRQVYTSRKNTPTDTTVQVVREYAGTLPDHNEININSFETQGNHTVLTLDTLWKAPFFFDILPQSYTNPNNQDYSVSKVTFNYIDITFCYTTSLSGNISVPKTNPVFSSAKIIKNKSDYTLRLYLRKQGGFYGWDSYYNNKGQLVFEFLNPARVTEASNAYGVNLNGVKILIDVGHGGKDPGALGLNSSKYTEASQNLALANKIKAQLQSIGATVYMTRTSNVTSSNDDKIKMLKQLKPDYCIAIHHDASDYSSPNGFGSYYSQPFSKKAAELVNMHTKNTGIYKSTKLSWHYYYMARSSYCPVVLTENGFITNTYDFRHITSDSSLNKKAIAITHGIADYFLSVSPDDVPIADDDEPIQPPDEELPDNPPEEEVPPAQSGDPEKPDDTEEPENPQSPDDSQQPQKPEDPDSPDSGLDSGNSS